MNLIYMIMMILNIMKTKISIMIWALAATLSLPLLTACENDDIEFDDYDYQTVYFSQQTPIRTITLGDDDEFSTELDNQHRFELYATLGGVWGNKGNRTVKIAVDNSLCDNLYFSDNSKVMPLPSNYYKLDGDVITIKNGEEWGCVGVQLTDEYFADPLSTKVTYVLPVKMVSASDSILCGKVKDGVAAPNRLNNDDWSVLPKDYVLYAVKYKNKYHGTWLSHGTDEIDVNGVKETVVREPQYIEKAELRSVTTASLNRSVYSLSTTVDVLDKDGMAAKKTLTCDLILDFDADDNCTVTTVTPDCSASGTGKWVKDGAKKAWGDKDRDELSLNYTVTFNYDYQEGGRKCYKTMACKDVLVMRDRQSAGLELFSYTIK